MLDLLSIAASACCLILWYCIRLICRRVEEVDEARCSRVIFDQPRLYRRYWELASDHHWSRIPVVAACAVVLCGLLCSAGVAALVISRAMK
jgi:hypothetical protein